MKNIFDRRFKKSLLLAAIGASSVLGMATTAQAQSSVQLYGQVDAWVGARQKPGQSDSAALLSDGGMSTSYWGLKGREDLGNKTSAIFTLEGFFKPQNGQSGRYAGDTFFSRTASVGFDTPSGTITAGRLTGPLFLSTIKFNPLVDSFVFSPMILHTFSGLGSFPSYTTDQGVIGDTGWDNAIRYGSPDFNGFSGSAIYGFGNTTANGAKKWAAQLQYDKQPFAISAVYQYINFRSAPGDLNTLLSGLNSQKVAQLGVSYDFEVVKVFGQYMHTDNSRQIGSWKVNTYQGGVSIPAGPGKVLASYAYSKDNGGLNQIRKTFALAYDYPLSKRTDVYVGYLRDQFNKQPSNNTTGNTYGMGLRVKF